MKYASHNSLSYLPPRNIWGKITKVWGKCQSLDLIEQSEHDIRYFDIRVKPINKCWHIVHNNVDYGELDIVRLTKTLNVICNNVPDEKVYIRLGLDVRKKPKDTNDYIDKFIALAKVINQLTLSNCIIDDCITFWNWQHFDFNTRLDNCHNKTVFEYHTSVCSNTLDYLKGTKWFAKKFNKYFRELFNNSKDKGKDDVIMLDYIQY